MSNGGIPGQKRGIMLDGRLLEYYLYSSRRNKHIRFRILSDATMAVSAPAGFPVQRVEEAIREKKDWIFKAIEQVSKETGLVPSRQYASGETLPLLGKNCTLQIIEVAANRIAVILEDDVFRVNVPAFLVGQVRQREIKRILVAWYRRYASSLIPARVAEINRQLFGFTYHSVKVKDQKTRWGSCSALKNLNFNWRLLLAAPEVLDYIIVHELAHLQELNHSARFWQLVESRCPGYRQLEKYLRREGKNLRF